MSELTIKMDCNNLANQELKEYLLSLTGIFEIKNDNELNDIYIKYNPDKINIKMIMMEIELFLDIKIPDIIGFDKHLKKESINYNIIIADLCCDFCLKSMIEDLLLIDGIAKANTDFDFVIKSNIIISINYDKTIITEEEIKKIEVKFNNHDFT